MPFTIEPDALQLLARYHWPGNVRELQNVIERLAAAAFVSQQQITAATVAHALPVDPTPVDPITITVRFLEGDTIDLFQARLLLQIYAAARARAGSHSRAARLLGTERVALTQRVERARLKVDSRP